MLYNTATKNLNSFTATEWKKKKWDVGVWTG